MHLLNYIVTRLKSTLSTEFKFQFWSVYSRQTKQINIEAYGDFKASLLEAESSGNFEKVISYVGGRESIYDWWKSYEIFDFNDEAKVITLKPKHVNCGYSQREWNLMYLIAMSTMAYAFLSNSDVYRKELALVEELAGKTDKEVTDKLKKLAKLAEESDNKIIARFLSSINYEIPEYLISEPGSYTYQCSCAA